MQLSSSWGVSWIFHRQPLILSFGCKDELRVCRLLSHGSVKPCKLSQPWGLTHNWSQWEGNLSLSVCECEVVAFSIVQGAIHGGYKTWRTHKHTKKYTQTILSQSHTTVMLSNTQVLCTTYETICLYCLVQRTIEKWVSGLKKNQLLTFQFEQFFFSQRVFSAWHARPH